MAVIHWQSSTYRMANFQMKIATYCGKATSGSAATRPDAVTCVACLRVALDVIQSRIDIVTEIKRKARKPC